MPNLLIKPAISFCLLLCLLLVSGIVPASAADSAAATEVELGEALASVNGVLIERESFDAEYQRLASFSTAADPDALAVDVLHYLIEAELILQFAAANALDVDDEVVDAEVASFRDNLGARRWRAWLSENLYTEAEFRAAIQLQFARSAVRAFVTAHLRDEAPHVRARHILVARESEAEQVLVRLLEGESFAALAARLSLDVSTSAFGGDLGWFVRGELLDPSLGDAAFSQSPGEIGGPIAIRLGYHILQVVGKAEREIEAGRLPNIAENIFQLWLEAQVEVADIQLNLEALDAIADVSPGQAE